MRISPDAFTGGDEGNGISRGTMMSGISFIGSISMAVFAITLPKLRRMLSWHR
jgi:hypothetical protein